MVASSTTLLESMSQFDPIIWPQAESLRCSAFSSGIWQVEPSTLFGQVFDGEPDTVVERHSAGEKVATATREGQLLTVKRSLNRLDWQIEAGANHSGQVFLDGVEKLLSELATKASQWCATQDQPVVRFAVGGMALAPADSRESAYRFLAKCVRIARIDIERFRDFRLQLNLQTPSEVVQDLLINRVTVWASLMTTMQTFGESAQMLSQKHFASCTFDINSDAVRSVKIDAPLLPSLSREMVSHAMALLAKGID